MPTGVDVRLVVCDMDGTLLDAAGEIPADFWPLLTQMHERGIAFAPASGRQYATLAEMFPGADTYIAENGTIVVHEGRVVSTTDIDRPTVDSVIDAVRNASGHDLGLVVCGRDSAYIERVDGPFREQVDKYYVALTTLDDLHTVDDEVLKLAVYTFDDAASVAPDVFAPFEAAHQVVVSNTHWIDVMSQDANKGHAVRAMQQAFGISPAQTAVFGDYLNDLEMLGAGELSFAMDNAHSDIRAAARYLAPSNAEGGVLTVLRHLLDDR
ncbi:HAD family hydrolase [Microbacterium protaetiae]|uniref:HAD family hydrolase n=1 Tax=Microbacterium protaetiae TaxID=2509458 RepID=A0A4P6EH26_9MICO|nr:HAD family hydrolase [Microbacterium protaetiae]